MTVSEQVILGTNAIRRICEKRGLYDTPHLNTKLLLHSCGLDQISGLELYVNVRCLYLNGNNIEFISGLENLPNLQTLYLHVIVSILVFVLMARTIEYPEFPVWILVHNFVY